MVLPFIEKGQLVPILVDWRPDPHAVYCVSAQPKV